MATSILQNPFKGYRVIAETGSSSDTWGSKLTALKSAYDSLSDDEKYCAFLMYSSTVANVCYITGHFLSASLADTGRLDINMYDLNTPRRSMYSISLNNNLSTSDTTNNTTTQNIKLCVRL